MFKMNKNKKPEIIAKECSDLLKMPVEPIYDCVRNKRGNKLLHDMGVLTLGLNPSLNYVPWINVNNIHTNENQKQAEHVDLVQLICKNYRGCGRPSVCTNKDDVSCTILRNRAVSSISDEISTKKVKNSGYMIRFNYVLIVFILFFF